MSIKIRKLRKSDFKDLYGLGLEEWKGERWLTKQFLKETMKPPGYDYVACDGKKVVGGILVEVLDRPKMWIFFFVVGKKYRRQGVGSQLLKAVEKDCFKDFPLLFVDIGINDIEGSNFYKKHGFKKQAEIKDWFDLGEAGIIYSKKLIK
jgi:ribosomal protein S18 acetylase RimI-like enzyme